MAAVQAEHELIEIGLLGHADVSTTMIYTHVLQSAVAGTVSPLDGLMLAADRGGVDETSYRDDHRPDHHDDDDDNPAAAGRSFAARRSLPSAREPSFPCYRVTPSFTAAAISAF